MAELATSTPRRAVKRKRSEGTSELPPILVGEQLGLSVHKWKHLRIEIPPFVNDAATQATQLSSNETSSPISGLSEPDSLFDEPTTLASSRQNTPLAMVSDSRPTPALLSAPKISGLFFAPNILLPEDEAASVMQFCLAKYFQDSGVNQVMLFGRFLKLPNSGERILTIEENAHSGLPPILISLLSTLNDMLSPVLPPETHSLLFPKAPQQARQAILNLYQPGEGITPHVDLLRRFGDGIIGVSLGSGCVMQFARLIGNQRPTHGENWDLYLPERSVIVLSGGARYEWTHGIRNHKEDYVSLPDPDNSLGEWIKRGVRLSITFRWLLPGADVVGEGEPETPT